MAAQVIVTGTVKADGSLELDEKVGLPAGRVQVMVQPITAGEGSPEMFAARIQAIWTAQRERGNRLHAHAEVEAQRGVLRREMEGEIQEAIQLQQVSRQARHSATQPPKTSQ